MKAVLVPTAPIQARNLFARNSAQLSDRMYCGGPRRMNRSVKASTTLTELSFRLTQMTRASFVNSSIMLRVRYTRLSWSGPGQSQKTRRDWFALGDPLPAAQFCNAVLAAKAGQDNADLLFRAVNLTGCAADVFDDLLGLGFLRYGFSAQLCVP